MKNVDIYNISEVPTNDRLIVRLGGCMIHTIDRTLDTRLELIKDWDAVEPGYVNDSGKLSYKVTRYKASHNTSYVKFESDKASFVGVYISDSFKQDDNTFISIFENVFYPTMHDVICADLRRKVGNDIVIVYPDEEQAKTCGYVLKIVTPRFEAVLISVLKLEQLIPIFMRLYNASDEELFEVWDSDEWFEGVIWNEDYFKSIKS